MKKLRVVLFAVSIALAFAFVARWIFGIKSANELFSVMTMSFLVLLPFAVGFLTIYFCDLSYIESKSTTVVISALPIFAFLFLTLFFSIEGMACWIMALPIFLIASGLGGLTARYLKIKKAKGDRLFVSLVVLLPFLMSPIENIIGAIPGTYKAYTEINIEANKDQIWQNVTRVRDIRKQDDKAVFTRTLGFPRPIKAELDKEAVGGKRQAIFDKGLVFEEVVSHYEHQKAMTFTIHANPYDIPSTTMDQHIVIGGQFFDVLTGTYQLEEIDDHNYKLKLFSTFKLNTTFNFYAGIWATWIMKDIQQNILKVIKERAEKKH